jgi:hypothetical protein
VVPTAPDRPERSLADTDLDRAANAPAAPPAAGVDTQGPADAPVWKLTRRPGRHADPAALASFLANAWHEIH